MSDERRDWPVERALAFLKRLRRWYTHEHLGFDSLADPEQTNTLTEEELHRWIVDEEAQEVIDEIKKRRGGQYDADEARRLFKELSEGARENSRHLRDNMDDYSMDEERFRLGLSQGVGEDEEWIDEAVEALYAGTDFEVLE